MSRRYVKPGGPGERLGDFKVDVVRRDAGRSEECGIGFRARVAPSGLRGGCGFGRAWRRRYWTRCEERSLDAIPPDVFDIDRRPRHSLSFGHGAHECIGEHLGKLEGRILLEEILAVAPEYEVDAAGAGGAYSEFLHDYDRMPIEFDPRSYQPQGRHGVRRGLALVIVVAPHELDAWRHHDAPGRPHARVELGIELPDRGNEAVEPGIVQRRRDVEITSAVAPGNAL